MWSSPRSAKNICKHIPIKASQVSRQPRGKWAPALRGLVRDGALEAAPDVPPPARLAVAPRPRHRMPPEPLPPPRNAIMHTLRHSTAAGCARCMWCYLPGAPLCGLCVDDPNVSVDGSHLQESTARLRSGRNACLVHCSVVPTRVASAEASTAPG